MAEDDAENLRSARARAPFRGLSEEDVFREMEIENSRAAAEVTRLVAAYFCKTSLQDQGLAAASAIMIEVSCPIENVAVFTLLAFLDNELRAMRRDSWN
jgi:hypothetical protein